MMQTDDLDQRLAEIEAREHAVAARERAVETKGIRRNLYEHITLSRRSIDLIIIACAASILGCIIFGMIYK